MPTHFLRNMITEHKVNEEEGEAANEHKEKQQNGRPVCISEQPPV